MFVNGTSTRYLRQWKLIVVFIYDTKEKVQFDIYHFGTLPPITDIAEFVNEDRSVDIGCTAIAGPTRLWNTQFFGEYRVGVSHRMMSTVVFPIKKLEMIKCSIMKQGIESMYISSLLVWRKDQNRDSVAQL